MRQSSKRRQQTNLPLPFLALFPGSASSEVNARVGAELSVKTIKRALDELVAADEVVHQGERRWWRYWRGSKGQTVAESGAKPSRDLSPTPASV